MVRGCLIGQLRCRASSLAIWSWPQDQYPGPVFLHPRSKSHKGYFASILDPSLPPKHSSKSPGLLLSGRFWSTFSCSFFVSLSTSWSWHRTPFVPTFFFLPGEKNAFCVSLSHVVICGEKLLVSQKPVTTFMSLDETRLSTFVIGSCWSCHGIWPLQPPHLMPVVILCVPPFGMSYVF